MSLYICPNHKVHNIKSDPKVNCGFWVIMCQCRLVSCNKCTILWGNIDHEGGCARVVASSIPESSVCSPQFCCEAKTPLKMKVVVVFNSTGI